jgi:hypothetical protein
MSKPYIRLDETWIDKVPNCPNCGGQLISNHGWPLCETCMNGRSLKNKALRHKILIEANCKIIDTMSDFEHFYYQDMNGKAVIRISSRDGLKYVWRRLPGHLADDVISTKQRKGVRIDLINIDGEVDNWVLMDYWLRTPTCYVDIRQAAFKFNLHESLDYAYIIDRVEYFESEDYDDKPFVYAFDNSMWSKDLILELRKQRPYLVPSSAMATRIKRLVNHIPGPRCANVYTGAWHPIKQLRIMTYLTDHPEASIREMSRELNMSQRIISKALDIIKNEIFEEREEVKEDVEDEEEVVSN